MKRLNFLRCVAPMMALALASAIPSAVRARSEEHTSELQSPCNLVCRLLLEKKKTNINCTTPVTVSATDTVNTVLISELRAVFSIHQPPLSRSPSPTTAPYVSTLLSPSERLRDQRKGTRWRVF